MDAEKIRNAVAYVQIDGEWVQAPRDVVRLEPFYRYGREDGYIAIYDPQKKREFILAHRRSKQEGQP